MPCRVSAGRPRDARRGRRVPLRLFALRCLLSVSCRRWVGRVRICPRNGRACASCPLGMNVLVEHSATVFSTRASHADCAGDVGREVGRVRPTGPRRSDSSNYRKGMGRVRGPDQEERFQRGFTRDEAKYFNFRSVGKLKVSLQRSHRNGGRGPRSSSRINGASPRWTKVKWKFRVVRGAHAYYYRSTTHLRGYVRGEESVQVGSGERATRGKRRGPKGHSSSRTFPNDRPFVLELFRTW